MYTLNQIIEMLDQSVEYEILRFIELTDASNSGRNGYG